MEKQNNQCFQNLIIPTNTQSVYFKQPINFRDCDDHYQLIYTGEFQSVGRENGLTTKLMQDLKDGDKDKELHILINSIGGDVENLIMILQQVLQYKHRVTVCCGAAISAGFILWACGHEKYVSLYSQLMYHTIFSGYQGKGTELTNYGNHIERLTDKIMQAVNMKNLITKDDMIKGKSTQVWYTGQDFIKSGKAKSYQEYVKRIIPECAVVLMINNRFFAKSGDNYVQLIADLTKEYTYNDLSQLNQGEVNKQNNSIKKKTRKK